MDFSQFFQENTGIITLTDKTLSVHTLPNSFFSNNHSKLYSQLLTSLLYTPYNADFVVESIQ